MGFTWAPSLEDALSIARAEVGGSPSTTLVDLTPVFIPEVRAAGE